MWVKSLQIFLSLAALAALAARFWEAKGVAATQM
jgi:hypothetical protein